MKPVAPEDEARHQPDGERLWNESWYADGISEDGSVGVYVRLGRMPNQHKAIYTACVCGLNRPTVMLVDSDAPLPDAADDTQLVKTDLYSASQCVHEPFGRFSMHLDGTAAAIADPASILRVDAPAGDQVAVTLDLTWETDGAPYRWPIGNRYEVPCRIRGTVQVGDEAIEIAGPGQRDHSWGTRDWWGSDWMWSAFHLEDGTHTHLVTTPAFPGSGIGYVQSGSDLIELREATSAHEIGSNGLVTRDRIAMPEADLELGAEPIAYGPVRLAADDGYVSHFVRAMSRVRSADGRSGLGWIEWNLNQPS